MSGYYVTNFLKSFDGLHVTPTFIRQLLETDVAKHGNKIER